MAAIPTVWRTLVSAMLICGWAFLAAGQEADELGGITVYDTPATKGYRKSWALLIGVNYGGRQEEMRRDPANQQALPELKNAANDAKALAKVLTTYYQYEDDAVTVLTDDGDIDDRPTAARIREEITKLCDPHRVQERDSVLVFFAGHGLRFDDRSALKGRAVALLPYDVQLSGGRLVGLNKIDVPEELVKMVNEIPARCKLIVLDCCYSGEIFSAGGAFQPRGDAANRSDLTLQNVATFQAMASCRARQIASDGRDGNSRFTTAILDGLKHIPARSDGDRRVWANRLLAYIRPEFDEFQRPDCRELIGSEGEFCFFPRDAERFQPFVLHNDDKSLLRAMVVSLQGNWWFEEMPWFIPAIRADILRQHERANTPARSPSYSKLIELEELQHAADDLINSDPVPGGDAKADKLAGLRYQHARELMAAHDAKKVEAALLRIEEQLTAQLQTPAEAASRSPMLRGKTDPETLDATGAAAMGSAAEDMHFLAVVQHALGKKIDAHQSYLRALAAYEKRQETDPERLRPSIHILAALCRADYGEFQLQELREPQGAAGQFSSARNSVLDLWKANDGRRSEDSVAFFRIYTLCREADAWLAVNRWSMANQLLAEALDVAEALAPNHYLQAHVHHQQAWSQIIQWQIQAAKSSFLRSNEIIDAQFRKEAERRGDVIDAAQTESEPSTDTNRLATVASHGNDPAVAIAASMVPRLGRPPLDHFFRKSTDWRSKNAYLHNHHGMAMAARFAGDTRGSARYYRWLYGEVEITFDRFRDTSSDVALERLLLTRRINTQERLADCNLFGEPAERDLPEAVDDYRRALNLVHLLRGAERERTQASLLYKQALALSLSSPIQETQLALEMCRRADNIYDGQRETATGLWQALGELTTKVVQCIHASGAASAPTAPDVTGCDATCRLRETIERYRDLIGTAPHRDQLELCLFASKVLLEHGSQRDKYQSLADTNLLLSFCRIALKPSAPSQEFGSATVPQQSESQAYLRPYYDAVMRAKLRYDDKHVKDLLVIQAEATQGKTYLKSEHETAILAIYVLEDTGYLLVDLPQGFSKCVALADMYDIETIRRACYESTSLPLPQDIQRAIVEWQHRPQNRDHSLVELRWEDPIQGFAELPERPVPDRSSRATAVTAALPKRQFPFSLPTELENASSMIEEP